MTIASAIDRACQFRQRRLDIDGIEALDVKSPHPL